MTNTSNRVMATDLVEQRVIIWSRCITEMICRPLSEWTEPRLRAEAIARARESLAEALIALRVS